MKKKLILMLSMVALLVCIFAISVSANTYFDFTNVDFKYVSSSTVSYAIASIDDSTDVGLLWFSADESHYGFYNIEWWHELFVSQNITSESQILELVNYGVEQGYWKNDEYGDVGYELASSSHGYWPVYQAYVAELNTPTYEDGKTDGVTEYKASTEYNTALNEKYVEGKADGIEYFKNSTEYENTLSVKYATGLADGKTNYIESDEYVLALKTEYDSGYSDGVAVTEDEASESKANNTFGIALGASLILILVVVVLYFSPKRKRRR